MILRYRPEVPSVNADSQASFFAALEACRRQTLNWVTDMQPALLKQQAHPDFSPIGWHLGHIAYTEALWMTERSANQTDQFPLQYQQLFSAEGLPKKERENLPDLEEILAFLSKVRESTLHHLSKAHAEISPTLLHWLIQHESQHAETIAIVLALHDLKKSDRKNMGSLEWPINQWRTNKSINNIDKLPLNASADSVEESTKESMIHIKAGSFVQGCDEPFAIDNEKPAHSVWLDDYWIDRRLVTCKQYRRFIEAGGYHQKKWWTTAGWRWNQATGAKHPLYGSFYERNKGEKNKDESSAGTFDTYSSNSPVCGVSWYEADAYARFVGKRLPTELEWAKAASKAASNGDALGCENMLGGVWQWTSTWFDAYPGFEPFPYAGYSQAYFDEAHRVLRGGSWATPQWALRRSFRNWYHPHRREMFAGFRCAA